MYKIYNDIPVDRRQVMIPKVKERFVQTQTDVIPNLLWQTYNNIDKIPDKVYTNLKQYAPNYKHNIYDDEQCLNFLQNYYGDKVVKTFNDLQNPAHKADLWRYCILYMYGGIYLDIKTELLMPLENIFTNRSLLYTVIANEDGMIYQGILASPPKNKIFLELIEHIIKNKNTKSYNTFILYFYEKLKKDSVNNSIKKGFNEMNKYIDTYLFKESCTQNTSDCPDGLDRYNWCCYVYDKYITNENKIIKVRYSDYPWHGDKNDKNDKCAIM
jgi:mannosyltransferase OCH1-like enzyme